ncbi:DNA-binding MarR family transcriptional regulator [Rhizobium sp. BK529]|uniref:MarR family winged helix-turn-helix transcriptional regulator n=1 Tax=unclassified Rhizobium TaxID=2613769 RepID=UPI001043AE09|nr:MULTISPECIES: MarR family winged helix-turn-helix transcriptional regulator [unclassified Rhizobium]MBB3591653.1 DNA-binding MarR family transcriptional regulator [Rhizobium sp. BK529]TCS08400.1 MarR family transcriptional regulator [Rhizobium sp. BK418]
MNERTKSFEGWQVCSNSALKRATRQLGQLYDDLIDASGLRGTQYTLMTQIHMNSGSSLKVLAESMVMDLSALGHTLKPLIRDGMVELVPDGKDRRVKRVKLTEAGIEKWQEATRLWREAHERFERLFGEEQAKALRDTLNLIASKDFAGRFRAGSDKD